MQTEIEFGTRRSFPPFHIFCDDCAALCCRAGVSIVLSESEAEFLKSAGTDLQREEPKDYEMLEPGHSFFRLLTDCAYIDPVSTKCTVWDSTQRPRACDTFAPGNQECRVLRVLGKIDS